MINSGSTVDEIVTAIENFLSIGTPIFLVDGIELCKMVSFTDGMPASISFFKASTNQLVNLSIGESVSVSYKDIGGGTGGGIQILKQTFTDYNSLLTFTNANSTKISRITAETIAFNVDLPAVSTDGLREGAVMAKSFHTQLADTNDGSMYIGFISLYIPSLDETATMWMDEINIQGATDGSMSWEGQPRMDIYPEDFGSLVTEVTVYYYSE
jgi:hypothetical protein